MTYSNWDESKHPRDNDGKFTYKNGGSYQSSTIERIEKQKKEIEELARRADVLYPTMKKGRTYQTPPFAPKQQYDYKKEENPKNPEDILYPTMKTKGGIAPNNPPIMKYMNTQLGGDATEQGTPTGSAAEIQMPQSTNLGGGILNEYLPLTDYLYNKTTNESNNAQNIDTNKRMFYNSIKVVLQNEGGFSDDPNDFGGRTNYGITQTVYNEYRKKNNAEIKDIKDISREEAMDIYYNNYWKASGADKISNPVGATVMFDTAVLHGVGRAKQYYKESGGDFAKMLDLRNEHYARQVEKHPSQAKFLNGWNNRVNRLRNMLKDYENEKNKQ